MLLEMPLFHSFFFFETKNFYLLFMHFLTTTITVLSFSHFQSNASSIAMLSYSKLLGKVELFQLHKQ